MKVRLAFLRVISVLLGIGLFITGILFYDALEDRMIRMEEKLELLSIENQKNSEAIEELRTVPPVGIGTETQDYIGSMLDE